MPPKTILITGASSGIGRSLAFNYAKASKTLTLILCGQNSERLNAVKTECEQYGATVELIQESVANQQEMEQKILALDDQYIIDMVIANAGISVGQRPRDRELLKDLFDINVNGLLNTIMPLIPRFKDRGSGHIVVMSSLAAFQVFPSRGEYGATKIAVRYLADSWRLGLKEHGIHVTSIHPGFVKTPLTDKNTHKMPGIVSAEKAADIIRSGLDQKKAVIAFPKTGYLLVRILQALPTRVSDWIVSKFKPS